MSENKRLGGFTQRDKKNIAKCDGCACHCDIATEESFSQDMEISRYRPMIGGNVIRKYVNKYGEEVNLLPICDQIKCMEMAFNIARLCDNYKTK